MEKIKHSLRIDDIGASSKEYEVYSNKWQGLGNFLIFKYLPYFKAWGPYRELNSIELQEMLSILEKNHAKLTVAITAAWVNKDGSLAPYPEKFPEQANILKEGLEQGLLEIANHGLTHCIETNNMFLPRLFTSNRKYHREFWSWRPEIEHDEHLKKSQEILSNYFKTNIVTLVPPGNVYSDATLVAAKKYGIKYINCNTADTVINGINIISNNNVTAFHDRELIIHGIDWLKTAINNKPTDTQWVFVRDLHND